MRLPVALLFGLTFAPGHLAGANFGVTAAYPHLHPKHSALACGDCHAIGANQTDIHEAPGHATCAACHNFAEEASKRAESFCGDCHTSMGASKDRAELFAFPKSRASHDFGDEFSHVAHKNAGTASRYINPGTAAQSHCADCHSTLPLATTAPEKELEASHAFCFGCHGDKPRGYTEARRNLNPSRNDCAACHVPHEAAMTSFVSVPQFHHADHLFDTRPRLKSAGAVSTDPDLLCVECHRTAAEAVHLSAIRQPSAATCNSCHTGNAGLPRVLPATLLLPLEAPR